MSSAAEHRRPVPSDNDAILDALPNPVLMIGPDGKIVAANIATEAFFDISTQFLKRQSLKELVPFGSPLLALIDQVRSSNAAVNEYKVDLGTPRMGGDRQVDLHVAPLTERPGHIVVMLQERSIADKMDRQLTHRSAARSVIALAAMLAHEIKNPLSGIRGAAQLLEQQASSEDRMLTRLICDEADRIVTLVDRMEVFGDERPVVCAVPSTSIRCSITSNGWRNPALPATSASSRITIPRCRRCWRTRTSSSRCSSTSSRTPPKR
ncbi:nitrogen-specific signal transduction histidine kinase [Bradyrhizobium sp. LB7.2]